MKRFTAFMRKPLSHDDGDMARAAGARPDETEERPTPRNEHAELADTLGKLSLTASVSSGSTSRRSGRGRTDHLQQQQQHASSLKSSSDDLDAQLGRLKLEGPLTRPTIPPHLVPLPPSPDLEERGPLVWPAPPASADSNSLRAKVKQEEQDDDISTETKKRALARRTPKKKQSASATPGGAAEEWEAAASPAASTSAPKPSRASPRLKERLASPAPSTSCLAQDFQDSSAEEDAEGDSDDEYFPEASIPSTGGRRPSKDIEVVTSTDAHQRPRRERLESPVPLSPPGAGQAPPSPPPDAPRGSPTLFRSLQQPLASTPPPILRSFAPPPPSAARASPAATLVPRVRAPALSRLANGVPSPPSAPAPSSSPPPSAPAPALVRSFAAPPPARRSAAHVLDSPPPPPPSQTSPAPARAQGSRSRMASPFSLFGGAPSGRSARVGSEAEGMRFSGPARGGATVGMAPTQRALGSGYPLSPFEGDDFRPYTQAAAFASYASPPQASYSSGPFNSFTTLEETYARFDRSTASPASDLFGFTDNVDGDSFSESRTDNFSTLLIGESAAIGFETTELLNAEEATYLETLNQPLVYESPVPAAPLASDSSLTEEQVNSLSSSYEFAEAWTETPIASTSTSFLSSSDLFVASPPEGSFSSPPSTLDSHSPSFPPYQDAAVPSMSSAVPFPFSTSSSSLSKNLADASDEELQRELERRKLERELAQIAALSPPMDNTVNPAHLQLPSPPTIYDSQPFDSSALDPISSADILVQPLPPLPALDAVYPSITSSQRSSTPNARPFTHQSRASRPTPLSRPYSSSTSTTSPSSKPRDLLDCYEYIPSEVNPARGQYVCRICKDRPLEPGKKRKMGEYSGTRGAPSSIATRAWGHWDKYHGGL